MARCGHSRAAAVLLLLLLPTLLPALVAGKPIVTGTSGALDQCTEQSLCLKVTVNPQCTTANGVSYKSVCLEWDNTLPGCNKGDDDQNDAISHVCSGTFGTRILRASHDGSCPATPISGPGGDKENRESGADPWPRRTKVCQCVVVGEGNQAVFHVKDGNAGSCGTSTGMTGCEFAKCSSPGPAGCTNNGQPNECKWSLFVGPCNGPCAEFDPHIRGLDGSSYILWGKNNTVYNLLSERNHHINVRLYHPAGHPDDQALYIDAVGILIRSARLSVNMVKAGDKDAHLSLAVGDGPAFAFPGHMVDRAVDAFTSYSFRSPKTLTVSSRDLVMTIALVENYFINVMIDEVSASWSNVHGVLGQTHSAAFKLRYNYARGTAVGELPDTLAAKNVKKMYKIAGGEDDYITSSLLKADDKFSRFVASAQPTVPASRRLANAALLVQDHASDRVRSSARTGSAREVPDTPSGWPFS